MAKENLNIQEEEEVEKGPGFFKKLFLFVLIPLLFIIAILLIVATFTNTNVFQTAQNITGSLPFISSDKDEIVENTSLNEEKVVTLQADIQQKEAEIAQLQTQIDSVAEEKQDLLVEQERLNYEIEKLKRDQEETKKEFNEILSTFEKMSAKKAAPILVEMSDTEALRIMSNMKPDTLSEIFTKMTPANAARYTELLSQQ